LILPGLYHLTRGVYLNTRALLTIKIQLPTLFMLFLLEI
jgi:hypothetical protein